MWSCVCSSSSDFLQIAQHKRQLFLLPCCLSWLSSEIPWIIALPDVRDFQAALNCLWFVVVERREMRLNFISSVQSEKITQKTNNHSFFIPKPDPRAVCFCSRAMSYLACWKTLIKVKQCLKIKNKIFNSVLPIHFAFFKKCHALTG